MKFLVNCFKEYFIECNHLQLEYIPNGDLPNILMNFCREVKKKKPVNDKDTEKYKNTTFRYICGGLAQYLKDTRKIDIIKNEDFLCTNEMFLAKTKVNRENGLGDINSYPPIVPIDLKLISEYFKKKMYGNPNARVLQQICIFNSIYYLCRRTRGNLCKMTINTFIFNYNPNKSTFNISKGQQSGQKSLRRGYQPY